jgi:hypothetical protein
MHPRDPHPGSGQFDELLGLDGEPLEPDIGRASPLRPPARRRDRDALEGLSAKVLVLNRAYAAMRVVSAKRAFCLLARNIAEVIDVDTNGAADTTEAGQYVNYDFDSWIEVSQLQREFEPDRHDWVKTVRMDIAVPRIIRLLGYDKLPEQTVKLNRRNLFATATAASTAAASSPPATSRSITSTRGAAAAGTRGRTSSAPASAATPGRAAGLPIRPA